MAGEAAPRIKVSLVYALPDRCWQATLSLAEGSTLAEAIEASGLLDAFPDLDRSSLAQAGIHGRLCPAGHRLSEGDRIEVLRPLFFDPLESRRRRARRRQRLALNSSQGTAT